MVLHLWYEPASSEETYLVYQKFYNNHVSCNRIEAIAQQAAVPGTISQSGSKRRRIKMRDSDVPHSRESQERELELEDMYTSALVRLISTGGRSSPFPTSIR